MIIETHMLFKGKLGVAYRVELRLALASGGLVIAALSFDPVSYFSDFVQCHRNRSAPLAVATTAPT